MLEFYFIVFIVLEFCSTVGDHAHFYFVIEWRLASYPKQEKGGVAVRFHPLFFDLFVLFFGMCCIVLFFVCYAVIFLLCNT